VHAEDGSTRAEIADTDLVVGVCRDNIVRDGCARLIKTVGEHLCCKDYKIENARGELEIIIDILRSLFVRPLAHSLRSPTITSNALCVDMINVQMDTLCLTCPIQIYPVTVFSWLKM
jgi:hypothetical protein